MAPWTGHAYDFEIWTRLGFYMQTLASPYTRLQYVPGLSFAPFPATGSIGYPPLSAFLFALTYQAYLLLGGSPRFLYYFLLKQPMVLADIGVAVVLGKIILLSGDAKRARTSFLVWLYLPLGIIISSMWGQLDPISLLLSLLAVYYFLSSKWLASASMLGLSIYLKALPLVFLAVFLIQPRIVMANRLRGLFVSVAIPVLGTLIPAMALGWDFRRVYNYLAFQTAIPGAGAMSVLGAFYSWPSLSAPAHYFTGFLWIPVLIAAYVYIRRRNLNLVQGLLIAVLAFTVSRPFVSEQWTLYPVALLLLVNTRENIGHFLGLVASATAFLVANNTLLVMFFTPVSPGLFQWGMFPWHIFIIDQQPMAALRSLVMSASAVIYFIESVLVVLGKESIVNRAITLSRPLWPSQRLKVSAPGVGPA